MSLSLTEYRTLGHSGLRVSPLCLGTMTFGTEWGWGADVETSLAMLERYLEAGGNFIDTANIYTKGHSEVILGDWFRERGGRDRVVLATKFCGNLYPGDPNGGGAGRKSLITACEESLRRLKTDYLDLYWLHFWDPHTPLEETMRALDDLVRAGKLRHVGVSDTPAWRVAWAQKEALFRGWTPFIALQIEYSLLERSVEPELMAMARELGLGVTPWSPLKGGLLTGKYGRARHPEGEGRHQPGSRYLNEATFALLDLLEAIALEQGRGVAEVALAWVLSKPGVTSPILGARTVAQLEANLRALEVRLTAEQLKRLDVASEIVPPFPYRFLDFTRSTLQCGATINGVASEPWPLAPRNDEERW
jgi:aryl-alcohol dehydrogenase-like predicted oxidoreductase